METEVQPTGLISFNDFELNPRTHQLFRRGLKLRLRGQPIEILIILLGHRGEMVTREALRKSLWPQDTFVDFEHSLNSAIARLREALGDNPESPRYIETIPRLGYRFIAEVNTVSVRASASNSRSTAFASPPLAEVVSISGAVWTEQSPESAPAIEVQRTWLLHNWRLLAGAVSFALAGAAGLTWYLSRPLPTLHIASYTQITTPGIPNNMVIGSDGSSLYLELLSPADPEQPSGPAVVSVSGGGVTPRPIDLPPSKDYPDRAAWLLGVSPDGSKLLAGSELDYRLFLQTLWTVDAHGGGTRLLAKGVGSATWSPDGSTVVYSNEHGDLYTISSEGGDPRLLLLWPAPPGTPLRLNDLAWSPDGSRIRFDYGDRIWEVSADGKNLHEILPSWRASNPKYTMCCGRWTPDGDFFLFLGGVSESSRNLADRRQIWALDERRSWLHRTNLEPAQLTSGPTSWDRFAVSTDGKTVYSTGYALRGELVRFDSKSKRLAPYLGGISADFLSFSNDGKSLVYVTFPEGILWRANRDGSGLLQLTNPPIYPIAPWWSADGAYVGFFDRDLLDLNARYSISSQGGMPKPMPPSYPGGISSPDGKKVLLNGTAAEKGAPSEEPKKRYLRDLATGSVTELPPCPLDCEYLQWSPDSRHVVAQALTAEDLFRYDLRTNQWSRLNLPFRPVRWTMWSHDGHFIYFVILDFGGHTCTAPGIYRVPVTGGKPGMVVDLKGIRTAGFFEAWFGLDPEDNPLLLRDAASHEIYALALERK